VTSLAAKDNMSLSMKLRVESCKALPVKTKDLPDSPGSMSSTSLGVTKKTSTLPFINPNNFVFSGNPKQPSTLGAEKLSGTTDFVHLGGLPDRSIITHPAALCVRCSKSAAVCVSCMEYIVDCSILHYRRTRGVGAVRLFDSAIVEAGAGKLNKFLLFRIWKNSAALRLRQQLYRGEKSEKFCWNKKIGQLFNAWRLFVAEVLEERKHYYRESLEAKIHNLEQGVIKLDMENRAHARRISDMENQLASKDRLIQDLQEQLSPKIQTQLPLVEVDTDVDFSNILT
jgi:hypothetical protein